MRFFYSITIFFFSVSLFAENISDYKIEGMSIGDSLLSYMSVSEIKKNIENNKYKDDKYYSVGLYDEDLKTYDGIQIVLATGDNEFIIHGLDGGIFYNSKIDECLIKKNEIVKDILLILDKNISTNDKVVNHPADESGNSRIYVYTFDLDNPTTDNYSDTILVYCTDWSLQFEKKYNWTDNLRVSFSTREFNYWFENYAYK